MCVLNVSDRLQENPLNEATTKESIPRIRWSKWKNTVAPMFKKCSTNIVVEEEVESVHGKQSLASLDARPHDKVSASPQAGVPELLADGSSP